MWTGYGMNGLNDVVHDHSSLQLQHINTNTVVTNDNDRFVKMLHP